MSNDKDMVTFHNIQRSYPPGEEMALHYQIETGSDLKTSKRDWVGLFRVGWTSSRDYYTFEWAPEPNPETNQGSVKFAGRRLPPEDGHFYQLCYVSRDGTVRGASAPFQFAPLSVSLEDMELVEITDDSMKSVMVLQKKSKELESLRREREEVRTELVDVQRSLAAAKTKSEHLANENVGLREQLEATGKEHSALQGEVVALKTEIVGARGEVERLRRDLDEERRMSAEKDAHILDLEQEMAITCGQLKEQLAHKQEHVKELLTGRENEEEELKVLRERLSTVEGEVVVLMSEGEDLKQQIRIKDSQVDDLQHLAGTRGEELEQAMVKLQTAEAKNTELHATCSELRATVQQHQEEIVQQQGSFQVDIGAALSQKDEQIEKLEQELACTQANVAELIGAKNQSTELPRHHPPPSDNRVDKGAYIALQHAYETFEKYYADEKVAKERVVVQLKNVQEENALLKVNHQDMVQRVLVCKSEYESKAQECVELQRRLKKEGLLATNDIRSKPSGECEMEREREEMIQNCQTAAAELSLRRKDCDEKSTQVTKLEAELAGEIQRCQELQDRYDKKIAEKNEEIGRQKLLLAEKDKDLARITAEKDEQVARVNHLTGQIRSVKQPREESSRCCPVCNTKFPLRMSEQDFERHVQAHFETV